MPAESSRHRWCARGAQQLCRTSSWGMQPSQGTQICNSGTITAPDTAIFRLSRANCLHCQVAVMNNVKKTHGHLLFLFFLWEKAATEGTHHQSKSSEVNGGVGSPPDLASTGERQESPRAVCAAAGPKVIKEPDTEPSLTSTSANKQLGL